MSGSQDIADPRLLQMFAQAMIPQQNSLMQLAQHMSASPPMNNNNGGMASHRIDNLNSPELQAQNAATGTGGDQDGLRTASGRTVQPTAPASHRVGYQAPMAQTPITQGVMNQQPLGSINNQLAMSQSQTMSPLHALLLQHLLSGQGQGIQ